jgi:hypothetical protein
MSSLGGFDKLSLSGNAKSPQDRPTINPTPLRLSLSKPSVML